MKLLGNILWFLCGGIIGGLAWIIAGCIWCVTIVGIPVGLQCFKFASLAFWPFGKEVVYGNGTFSFLVNLIWILFFGWGMALGNIVLGCMWCITIVGIPFGKQFFKMARLSFMLTKNLPEDKPIFVGETKIYNSTVNDVLTRHCKACGISEISIHGLRHTHASLLLFAGVSIASVARRLGHASMTTTQKTYLHIIQELENKDVDLVMRTLSGL